MSVRWLAPTVALCALLFADSPAVAQSATSSALERAVQVEPEGDACLSEVIVRARVHKRLARNAELSDVEVTVHVADPPRLEVSRGGQRIAERHFGSFPTRCNARRDAIAVAVALALERAQEPPAIASTGGGAETATAPSAAALPAAGAASTADTQPANAAEGNTPAASEASDSVANDGVSSAAGSGGDGDDPASMDLDFGVHAGIAAAFEILPSVAFAGVLGADLGLAPLGVNFSFSVLASLPEHDEVLGGDLESQLLLARLLALGSMDLGGIAFEGGFGVLAGGVFARGEGYASDRSTQLAYVAPLARAALRFPAENAVMIRIALDAMVAAMRPSYAVREGASADRDTVTPSTLGVTTSLEIAFHLD